MMNKKNMNQSDSRTARLRACVYPSAGTSRGSQLTAVKRRQRRHGKLNAANLFMSDAPDRESEEARQVSQVRHGSSRGPTG